MVAAAERYDATMNRTGGYKGSDSRQASSSKTLTPVTILLLSTYATGNDCRLLRKLVSLFCTKA